MPLTEKEIVQWTITRSVAQRRKPSGKGLSTHTKAGEIRPRLSGGCVNTRLPGGDERSEIVQWTISAKNARPVGGLVAGAAKFD